MVPDDTERLPYCFFLVATVAKYQRLGGLQITDMYFSQFWGLEVRDQGVSRCSSIEDPPLGCKWPFSSLFFFFLGLHMQHMEVPRLEVEPELRLPAYTTATATPDPSHICDLHHSSQQHQILNPLSENLWILVRCITAEPQQEVPNGYFLIGSSYDREQRVLFIRA